MKNLLSKDYKKKLVLLEKYNKHYYQYQKPLVSDKIYDDQGTHVGWKPYAQFHLTPRQDSTHCVFDTGYNGEGRGPKWTVHDRPTRGHVMRHPVGL